MFELKSIQQGEKVIRVIKTHKIYYAILGIKFLFIILLCYFIDLVLGFDSEVFFIDFALFLILLPFIYIELRNYRQNMLIITNNRVIYIEQVGLFTKNISETDITQVQEVNTQVKGILQNIFDYGDISIYTGGNNQAIHISLCPAPIVEATAILSLVEKAKASNQGV